MNGGQRREGGEGGGGSQGELGDGIEERIEAWDPGAVFFDVGVLAFCE
jgi:hypothetical protein